MRRLRLRTTLIPAALLLLIGLLAGLSLILGRDFSQPNLRFLPEMVTSVPYDSFDANPVFADGKTLQRPVPGTIARGHAPLHFAAGEEEALRAGRELINPVAATPEALARGARVYLAFCQVCHGETGIGDGTVTTRGFPPPPSLLAANARNLPDGQLFHIVTFGQNNMPPYAAMISPEDRWKVTLYVRSLQTLNPQTPAAEGAP